MDELNVVLSDKVVMPYLKGLDYIDCSNEGEAIAIAAGWWLAKRERSNVYMSADGLWNALNFITSWIIPKHIEMNIYVSIGREEPPHKITTDNMAAVLELLPIDPNKLLIKFLELQNDGPKRIS
jgi:hypothetical protein